MKENLATIEELRMALSAAVDASAVLAAAARVAAGQSLAEVVSLYQSNRSVLVQPCIEAKADSAAAALVANADDDFNEQDHPPISNTSCNLFDPLSISLDETKVKIAGCEIKLPFFVSDINRARLEDAVLTELSRVGVKSLCLMPLYQSGKISGIMEFRFSQRYHRWSRDDSSSLERIAEYCGVHLTRTSQNAGSFMNRGVTGADENEALSEELLSQYRKLAHFGNLLIVRTDSNLFVTEVLGDTEDIIGLTPAQMMSNRSSWLRFIYPADLRRLLLKIKKDEPADISEEIRVVNQRTGLSHWLLLQAVPRYSRGHQLLGWEGYAVDITEKHNAQEELVRQGKRIEALYTVSRSLQTSSDPALVTLKGLNALVNATSSDCGVGYFADSTSKRMEVVAAAGISQNCVAEFCKDEIVNALIEKAIEQKKGILLDDIQNSAAALSSIAKAEGLRSAIVMPLVFEDNVMGVLVLFRRRFNRYLAADFDLVAAASNQISLAAREAELHAAEKTKSKALAALYRLSHQLSKQVSLKEVIQNALNVVQEELACKRMWLGVINDQGTHIVGQAGFGPGIRQRIIDLQIELGLRHDFLDEALQSKQPIVVEAGAQMECSGLNKFIKQLEVGAMVLVPLIALGDAVGVLVVEPSVPSSFFAQSRLPLLNSMAGEIAPVILARKLQARMADAAKMRMASLLASGISHNFNNLLQAVMGQASLIELQNADNPKAVGSARMIMEAATKGAGLVKQLSSLSNEAVFLPSPIDIEQLFDDSRELYKSVLGSAISLQYQIEKGCGEILGDYSSIQQVMTNLLLNSKEAIGERTDGRVSISVRKVKLRSGEVDPELAPGSYLRVDIEDNGVGMDEEKLARCFEPFFTTKNVDARTGVGLGGSGLGLASAYAILKKHEGLITAASQLGKGATFSLYFPEAKIKNKSHFVDGEDLSALLERRKGKTPADGVKRNGSSAKSDSDSVHAAEAEVESVGPEE